MSAIVDTWRMAGRPRAREVVGGSPHAGGAEMIVTTKPRIARFGNGWRCWTPAAFGGCVVGFGHTPAEAYRDWFIERIETC